MLPSAAELCLQMSSVWGFNRFNFINRYTFGIHLDIIQLYFCSIKYGKLCWLAVCMHFYKQKYLTQNKNDTTYQTQNTYIFTKSCKKVNTPFQKSNATRLWSIIQSQNYIRHVRYHWNACLFAFRLMPNLLWLFNWCVCRVRKLGASWKIKSCKIYRIVLKVHVISCFVFRFCERKVCLMRYLLNMIRIILRIMTLSDIHGHKSTCGTQCLPNTTCWQANQHTPL